MQVNVRRHCIVIPRHVMYALTVLPAICVALTDRIARHEPCSATVCSSLVYAIIVCRDFRNAFASVGASLDAV